MYQSSVVVLSYQPIFLDGMKAVLAGEPSLAVLASGHAAERAPELVALHRPAVVLIDSGEADRGIATIARIREVHAATKVIVVTAVESVEHAVQALEAGAAGYLSSMSTPQELIAATRLVLAGRTYVSPTLATRVIAGMRRAAAPAENQRDALNLREEQIADHLLKGHTNREIAESIGLSEKTVKHYMTLLMQKFGARNRLELALSLGGQPRRGQRAGGSLPRIPSVSKPAGWVRGGQRIPYVPAEGYGIADVDAA